MNWSLYLFICIAGIFIYQLFLKPLVEEAVQKVKRRLKK